MENLNQIVNEEVETNESWELDEEFIELFPDVAIEDIPDEVFERAEVDDIPLVAAYALYDRKVYIENSKIEDFNKKNAKKSPGRIKHDGASEGYFTLEQIKRMSAADVEKHYDQVMKSLENISKQ